MIAVKNFTGSGDAQPFGVDLAPGHFKQQIQIVPQNSTFRIAGRHASQND